MIVVAGVGGVGGTGASQGKFQGFFGASLAGAARHRRDAGAAPGPGKSGQGNKALHCIVDNDGRQVGANGICDHRGRRSAIQGIRHEILAVKIRPGQRHEQITGIDRTAVDGNTRGGPIAEHHATGCGLGVLRSPKRHLHAAPRNSCAAAWACVASSKGTTSEPRSWPDSTPFPASTKMSPSSRPAMAARMACSRPGISTA